MYFLKIGKLTHFGLMVFSFKMMDVIKKKWKLVEISEVKVSHGLYNNI